jgi:hypothetical protein
LVQHLWQNLEQQHEVVPPELEQVQVQAQVLKWGQLLIPKRSLGLLQEEAFVVVPLDDAHARSIPQHRDREEQWASQPLKPQEQRPTPHERTSCWATNSSLEVNEVLSR